MKYKLTDEVVHHGGLTLHRIMATRDFGCVKKGDVGGYIESENNLSQEGDAWISGNSWVCGNARVCGDSEVYGDARIGGNAKISGDAVVGGNADFMVFKNSWSSGRYFTYTRSNGKWCVGCFYGTGEELIAKAYNDSEVSGKCYEAIVRAVEAIEKAKEAK